MPPHHFLKNTDIARMLMYVRQSFGNKAAAMQPEEAESVSYTAKNGDASNVKAG